MIDDERWQAFVAKREAIARTEQALKTTYVHPQTLDTATMQTLFGNVLGHEYALFELLRRPSVRYADVIGLTASTVRENLESVPIVVREQIEVMAKYQGYIARQSEDVLKQAKQENTVLPAELDYAKIHGLTIEAQQKLSALRPETIGQASRVSGVTPCYHCFVASASETKTRLGMNLQLQTELEAGLKEMRIALSINQQQQLLDYVALLQKWNRVYNLIANAGTAHILRWHLLDALSIVDLVRQFCSRCVLDVGAGAGLPSIPLAIALPQLKIGAIDAVQKKVSFMRQVKVELGLDNFVVHDGRVEDHLVEKVEVVVARALASLVDLVSCTQHVLVQHGYWLAMKGRLAQQELLALEKVPGVVVVGVFPLQVAGLDAERHLICLQKT